MKIQLEKAVIDDFFNEIFFEQYKNLRFSYLFKSQAYLLNTQNLFYDFNYRLAVKDIALGVKSNGGVKPDSQFTKVPLVGLWKKHVFTPDNLTMNLKSEILNEHSTTSRKIGDLFEAHEGEPFENIKDQIIGLTITGALEARSTEGRMTGEWIIYAEKGEMRYILCLANHKEAPNQRETDKNIYSRISRICFDEFPEINRETD